MPTELALDTSSDQVDGPSMQLSTMGNEQTQETLTQECSDLDGHSTESEASQDSTMEIDTKRVSKRKRLPSETKHLESKEEKTAILSKK